MVAYPGEIRLAHINLVKLCVGADTVADLDDWQRSPRAWGPDGLPRHITRMWPKRGAELTGGGSLYWVVRGVIEVRQRVLRLDEVRGDDGILRCALVLDPDLHLTEPVPRRPFQGWRYLSPGDAPADLRTGTGPAGLPPAMTAALAEIGVR